MTSTPQTILITGATGTVGSGLAQYFASRGHKVILTARDRTRLDELSNRLRSAPAYTANLSDPDSLESLAAQLQLDDHKIDVLINNAADVTSKPFLETSLEEIDRIIRTNITGTLQLSRLIGADMAQRGRGTIVNISSLAGYKPNPAQTVYSITKSALNATSEALRAGPRPARHPHRQCRPHGRRHRPHENPRRNRRPTHRTRHRPPRTRNLLLPQLQIPHAPLRRLPLLHPPRVTSMECGSRVFGAAALAPGGAGYL